MNSPTLFRSRPFLIIVFLATSGCRATSELYCDESTPCTAGHPICDLQGVCSMSDGIANTCIPEACWDASVGDPDANPTAIDASLDGFDASADGSSGPLTWSSLQPVANVNSDKFDGHVSISADGLDLYFESRRDGGIGLADIYVAKRSAISMAFGVPSNIGIVNTSGSEQYPVVTYDGLELYFVREGAMYVSRRGTIAGAWGQPTSVSISNARSMSLASNGLTMYYLLDDGLGAPRYRLRRRSSLATSWGPEEATSIPSEFGYWSVHVSGDELSVLLAWPFMPAGVPFAVELRRSSTSVQFEMHDTLAILQGVTDAAWSIDNSSILATHSQDIFVSVLE